jgi:bacillithiol biosynthesis deacetylase BshB1
MKLDILALAAHPDDVELSCSGIMLAHAAAGYKTGIIDFTQGELGTRGTAETRKAEAAAAAKILGVQVRENLGFADGFFLNDPAHQLELIRYIRHYRPEIVLANAPKDRHPDHAKAAALAVTACFLSGLKKIETEWEGEPQTHWRPKKLHHYVQSDYLEPTFLVDISAFWEEKKRAIYAFSTQFHIPGHEASLQGEQTFISSPEFMQFIEARCRQWGQAIGTQYAEGLIAGQALGVSDIFHL